MYLQWDISSHCITSRGTWRDVCLERVALQLLLPVVRVHYITSRGTWRDVCLERVALQLLLPVVRGHYITSRGTWRDVCLERVALQLPLPVVRVQSQLGACFQRNTMCLTSQCWDIVFMFVPLRKCFTCFTSLKCIWVPGRTDKSMCAVSCKHRAPGLYEPRGVEMAQGVG